MVTLELRFFAVDRLSQSIDVATEVAQNLEGQVAKRLRRALELLARVRLGHGHTQVFASNLPGRLLRRAHKVGIFGFLGVRVEVLD